MLLFSREFKWKFKEEKNQLGRIKEHWEREWSNAAEDARGSGDDQTEGDGEEGVEHLLNQMEQLKSTI